MGKLTALSVKAAKPGRKADGDGLYLLTKPSGSKSWLLRVQVDGKRRDIGLGSVDTNPKPERDHGIDIPLLHRKILTLAEAREKSALLRRVALAGRDPVAERDKDRRAVPSFKEAALACHVDLKGGWTEKSAAAFLSSLEAHAFPVLGAIRVDRVASSDVRDMLAPIWLDIPVMARKVRQRVGMVLNYAKSKGWREAEAPGKSVTLGLARHGAGGNFAAMPYSEVPGFVASLRDKSETVGRMALLFLIFTGARSGEVRSARWSEIDLEGKLWNRPASVMKSRTAHSVTLNAGALAVLKRAAELRTTTGVDALVFTGRSGGAISDMTISKIMRDAKLPYVPHGFRSSFRDFAAEQMPTIPDPVAESALAHVVPDAVIRAYKRTQMIELRRQLLDGWGDYVDGQSKVLRLAFAS